MLLVCFATLGLAADAVEQALDADFLSYLAEMEREDDDWTIVERVTAKEPPRAATDPIEKPSPPPPPHADEQGSEP